MMNCANSAIFCILIVKFVRTLVKEIVRGRICDVTIFRHTYPVSDIRYLVYLHTIKVAIQYKEYHSGSIESLLI